MFSVVMNNTRIDHRCLEELTERKEIESYKELYDFIAGGKSIEHISDINAIKIKEARLSIAVLNEQYRQYEKIILAKGIKVISTESDFYPVIWSGLTGMPNVLFLRGDPQVLKDIDRNGSVSIVGSRDPGRYSCYATAEFASKLAGKGVVITSGMAVGIDRVAHETAVDSGGKTLAVMPCGCEQIYPLQNEDIFMKIINGGGAVISELPPMSGVRKQFFPARNRLISALSDCCLIMEAGEHSGTLHTASYAAAQGRDVYVLPNNIYADNCLGGLKLINDGASILLDENDIIDSVAERLLYRKADMIPAYDSKERKMRLAELRKKADKTPEEVTADEIRELIEDELSIKDMSADMLCTRIKLPFYRVSEALSGLELDGKAFLQKGKYTLVKTH